MASKVILTPSIPKQPGFTTDTPFIGCRRDALLMPEAVDWSKIDQRPIKFSITPLVNPKNLEDIFASRVPATGSGGKYLFMGSLRGTPFGYAEYPHDIGFGMGQFSSHSTLFNYDRQHSFAFTRKRSDKNCVEKGDTTVYISWFVITKGTFFPLTITT